MNDQFMDEMYDHEERNGTRFSFRVIPNDRLSFADAIFPVGALVTPLKPLKDSYPLGYEPVRCRQCSSCLNVHCRVDYQSHVFFCAICGARVALPVSYHEMTQENPANELIYSTVEYQFQTKEPDIPPVFVFVIDTVCDSQREFDNLKVVLNQAVAKLPSNALIGIITYGSSIYLHELVYSEFPRVFAFSGHNIYDAANLSGKLHIIRDNQSRVTNNTFILNIEQCESSVISLLDKLKMDIAVGSKGNRKSRCTGSALHLATSLIECLFGSSGGQVLLFTSGPITKGGGAMATLPMTETVRHHSDIQKNVTKMSKDSIKFFNDLGANASKSNIVINYLAAGFEDKGLYEMEAGINSTGGWVMNCETWVDPNISQTLSKYFDSVIDDSAVDLTIDVITPPNLKIAGCIGPCRSGNKRDPNRVGEKEIGIGNTFEWHAAACFPNTTFAFYFEVSASKSQPIPPNTEGFVQFITYYRTLSTGKRRMRVTTEKVLFVDSDRSNFQIMQNFDQGAATVLLSRLAMWKAQTNDIQSIMAFIDKSLIKFCRKFGIYTKGQPMTFALPATCSYIPLFFFHFRRSPFMSLFNMSPDFTSTYRHNLLMESTENSLYMIQPTLMSFALDSEPIVAPLDMSSLQTNRVLLLDTFFEVLIWIGSDVASWRDQGFPDMEEYQNIKEMLEAPVKMAQQLIEERFPAPMYSTCDQDSSLARILVSKCNPTSSQPVGFSSGNIESGEPTYDSFFAKLRELAVNE